MVSKGESRGGHEGILGRHKELQEYIKFFKEYTKSEEYTQELKNRRKREEFFSDALKRENISELDDFKLGEIISRLWATELWRNKDYYVRKLISDNGLEKIREELLNLLYGGDKFEHRFNRFMKNVKGLGPASVTELLCFFNPKEYGIWNKKSREALKYLGFEGELPLNKYQISGEEYQKFNSVAKAIARELKEAGFPEADLLLVDYFLYEVWASKGREPKPPGDKEFDHDEVRDHLRDIGMLLGFDAEAEKLIAPGSQVDVVWRAKIGNLGTVEYVFEVHKGGSIKSLILNLQKASRRSVVQKVVAVSDRERLGQIEREVEGLPEDFLNKLTFWDVEEVERTYEQLTEVAETIRKIGLITQEFE